MYTHIICIAAVAAITLTGCLAPTGSTVIEYDAEGRITRRTETSESVVTSVTRSTQGKLVAVYDNSFLAYLSATTATAEDPSPTIKLGIGQADKGLLTVPEGFDSEVVGAAIKAMRAGEISASATGVEYSAGGD